jgi:hypothetical protein
MFFLRSRYTIYSFFLVLLTTSFPINATELIKENDGAKAYCNSSQDYERGKHGASRLRRPTVSLQDENHLLIEVAVEAAQCQKLGQNSYRWTVINPNSDILYEHSYKDLDTRELVKRVVKVENKKAWLAATNDAYHLVGSSDINGNLETGFNAKIKVDLSKVLSKEQLSLVKSGKSVKGRVGIFLKSITRVVSDEIITRFQEGKNGSVYYVNFNVSSNNGKLHLI